MDDLNYDQANREAALGITDPNQRSKPVTWLPILSRFNQLKMETETSSLEHRHKNADAPFDGYIFGLQPAE